MRIFLMIASMAESGGAEMLVRNLALEYSRRGHQCHIAYISDAASLNASLSYERAFQDQLDAAGVSYSKLGHACRRNPLLGGWRLRRVVRQFRPDVAHIHLGYGLLFQALGLVRTPTVYTHHNVTFNFPPRLFRLFDRFVDRYVAICGACEILLARYVRRPIQLIYNGVPADYSRADVRARPSEHIKVLSVGNLSPQKDYPTLVRAAERLVPHFASEGRTIRFDIAGSGDDREAIEESIRGHALEHHVRLLGTVGDVARRMAEADLILQASRWEGLPITLIEAAMSALPAVATDVGGCADIVLDGQTGLLVPPGSPEALARAVISLVEDEARYARFSVAAKRHAERFTLASCAEAHLALYHEIASRRAER